MSAGKFKQSSPGKIKKISAGQFLKRSAGNIKKDEYRKDKESGEQES